MEAKKIQVELPLDLYSTLREVSDASGWPLEEVVLRSIRSGAPPNLNKVPEDFHADLIALNGFPDRDLLRVVEGDLPSSEELSERRKKADFDTLRRTYALTLLKWRGHPVSKAYEALIDG
jgi:hypothetical protein